MIIMIRGIDPAFFKLSYILLDSWHVERNQKMTEINYFITLTTFVALLFAANSMKIILSKAYTVKYELARDDGLFRFLPLNWALFL